MEFKIDSEFQQLIPALTDGEFEQLEQSIIADGCRDTLVVWREGGLLLDGHNRYNICMANGLRYATVGVSLQSREAAINWIIDNQLGRRNLTPEQASYLRGKRYNLEKADRGGDRKSNRQNDELITEPTHVRLGRELGVSPKTIERDAKFADSVDSFDPDTKREILSGDSEYTKQKVIEARGEKEILEAARKIRQEKSGQRRAERIERNQALTQEPTPIRDLPHKFDLIYADPPWRYEFSKTTSREIENQYPTMALEDICAMPVAGKTDTLG